MMGKIRKKVLFLPDHLFCRRHEPGGTVMSYLSQPQQVLVESPRDRFEEKLQFYDTNNNVLFTAPNFGSDPRIIPKTTLSRMNDPYSNPYATPDRQTPIRRRPKATQQVHTKQRKKKNPQQIPHSPRFQFPGVDVPPPPPMPIDPSSTPSFTIGTPSSSQLPASVRTASSQQTLSHIPPPPPSNHLPDNLTLPHNPSAYHSSPRSAHLVRR